MKINQYITFSPSRRFPFGRWFPLITALYLLIVIGGLLTGALFTVAWETTTVSREDYNATDDYWGHYFDKYLGKDKGRCKPRHLQLSDEFYTTNGIFKWTIAEINYDNTTTKRYEDSELTEYSGQFLDNSVITSIYCQHFFATYQTEVRIWAEYYPSGDNSYLALQTRFTISDSIDFISGVDFGVSPDAGLGRSALMRMLLESHIHLDLFFVKDATNKTERLAAKTAITSFSMSPKAYGLDDGERCDSAIPRGVCENQDVYFHPTGRGRSPGGDNTANVAFPPERTTAQWDHGFNYALYSAAKYDLGHQWPTNALSNKTARQLYGITVDADTVPPAPPARLHTTYLCTFRTLKKPFNAFYSIVTSMSTLLGSLWTFYVLFCMWVGPKIDSAYKDYINPYDKLDDEFELAQKSNYNKEATATP